MPDKSEEINIMIEDIFKRKSQLNEWEIDFLYNIYRSNKLSNAQIDKINKIWDRVTS